MNRKSLSRLLILLAALLPLVGCMTQSALLKAAQRGNLEKAENALLSGADVNGRDRKGNSALHFAARHDASKLMLTAKSADWLNPATYRQFGRAADILLLINLLLRNGAEVNAVNNDGMTPLHFAAQSNSPHTALLLVLKGGNLLQRDRIGRTPLELAARAGNRDFLEILSRERRAMPETYYSDLESTLKNFSKLEAEDHAPEFAGDKPAPEPAP